MGNHNKQGRFELELDADCNVVKECVLCDGTDDMGDMDGALNLGVQALAALSLLTMYY